MTTSSTACERVAATRQFLPPFVQISLEPTADHLMQLIAFHDLYGVPRQTLGSRDPEFQHMDDERVSLRLGLITEELGELFRAVGIEFEPEFHVYQNDAASPHRYNENAMKAGYALRKARELGYRRDGREVADALGDLVYVIYGFALEMGYDLRAVIKEIHASNMTKLGEDGKPIYREDGKVLKGPNYVQPNIPAALEWEEN